MLRTPGEASAPQREALLRLVLGPPRARRRQRGERQRARDDAHRRDDQRDLRRGDRGQQAGQQRAEDEDQLDQHRVQRVGGLEQVRAVREQRRPHRAQHGRGRRDREPGEHAAQHEHGGRRAELRGQHEQPERRRVHERQRRQHAALAEAVHEPALHRRADAAARGQRPGHHAGDRERAGLLAQVEDHRERVDPDREARDQRRRDQRRDVRHPQHLAVAPHAARTCLAHFLRRASTSSIIASVSLPVNVFCWLGWKHPSSVGARNVPDTFLACSAPWANAGRGRGGGPP